MDRLNMFYVRFINAVRQDRGASGVEYGIMIAAVAAVIVVAAFSIGGKVGNAFDTVDNAIP